MPNVVKEQFNNMNQFKDIGYYYRQLGKHIYSGYVPQQFITGIPDNYGMSRFADYSDYWHKDGLITRKTLNLPYTITKYILDNMYSEQPVIDFGTNTKTIKYMNDVLEDNDFYRREKKLQGSKLNIGDYVLKPYIKDRKIKIDYIKGTVFLSTRTEEGKVIEGVFLTVKEVMERNIKVVYRRLEWHLKVDANTRKILYETYKSKQPNSLGSLCNLSTSNMIFGEQIEESEEFFYNLTVPTFILGKNPNDNNIEDDNARGLGVFMNTLHSIQSADESFEAKSTDIVYGSLQKLIPEGALDMDGVADGRGLKIYKHHNPRQKDIFVYANKEQKDYMPTAYAPTLRTEQHIQSINVDIDITSTGVGITAGALRFDGKSMVTATQVISEKSDTARTIKEIERNVSQDWKDLFMLIKYLANEELKEGLVLESKDIVINWKDSIIVDDETKKTNLLNMASKGWIEPYIYMAVEMGIDEDKAKELYLQAQAVKEPKNEEETPQEVI